MYDSRNVNLYENIIPANSKKILRLPINTGDGEVLVNQQTILNNFSSPHSIRANCEEDFNECLQSLDFFLKEKVPAPDISEESEKNHIPNEICFDQIPLSDAGQDGAKSLKRSLRSPSPVDGDRDSAISPETEDVSFTVVSNRKRKNKKKRRNTLLTSSSEAPASPPSDTECEYMSHQSQRAVVPEVAKSSKKKQPSKRKLESTSTDLSKSKSSKVQQRFTDLFGIENSTEVYVQPARQLLTSGLVSRVANGKVRSTADLHGSFFVEVKVYHKDDIISPPLPETSGGRGQPLHSKCNWRKTNRRSGRLYNYL
ncbi:hypothetical protein ACJJTC_016525 [Scirpophaga incertulas]